MQELTFPVNVKAPASCLYAALFHRANTLLLESADPGSLQHKQSLIGIDAALKCTVRERTVTVSALTDNGAALLEMLTARFKGAERSGRTLKVTFPEPQTGLNERERLLSPHPVDVLSALQAGVRPLTHLFMAGNISFDFITAFEKVEGFEALPDTGEPLLNLLVFETALTLDHQKGESYLSVADFTPANTFLGSLVTRAQLLRESCEKLSAEPDMTAVQPADLSAVRRSVSDADFENLVRALREHILAGDVFQVVPARTFSAPCPDPLLAYRILSAANPSPYMFFFEGEKHCLFGTSPEFALRYEAPSRQVFISPIAGTRPRALRSDGTVDHVIDSRVELELRTNQKELSEHIMLVDLARNDLARIALPGTTEVARLLYVAHYQHVMHLVTDVKATLRPDLDALHAYLSVMNMGTLSGAPKLKAHELIYRYEGKRRGAYGGTMVRLMADGSLDSCIVIRSAEVKEGTAYVSAGCGVTLNSVPADEAQETFFKARAVLNALVLAAEHTATEQ